MIRKISLVCRGLSTTSARYAFDTASMRKVTVSLQCPSAGVLLGANTTWQNLRATGERNDSRRLSARAGFLRVFGGRCHEAHVVCPSNGRRSIDPRQAGVNEVGDGPDLGSQAHNCCDLRAWLAGAGRPSKSNYRPDTLFGCLLCSKRFVMLSFILPSGLGGSGFRWLQAALVLWRVHDRRCF